MDNVELHNADCMDVMRQMPDNSIDLIATDPPYFKVKGEGWDRQWDKPHQFLAWMGELCEQWQRILKPNGSLYVFASPQMSARVECLIGDRFAVLNHITWAKPGPSHAAIYGEERFRQFVQMSERCIFAEHFNADNVAKGEAGYQAKCDELRGFVFEPLRAWFVSAWSESGLSRKSVDAACGCSNVTQYWFLERNYQIPTAEKYAVLKQLSPIAFSREYEDLRREYEELRRPFTVTADVPYTDVWTFKTVQAYKGKHPCEKPLEMMEHIVRASSREGATVLDCFMGGGSTGEACHNLGRKFIGIEKDAAYFEAAEKRIKGDGLFASGKDTA